ncbi:uncharacterized protein predicted to be involved in DNA repair (RAMP superfamily) [Xenococcus sp. PCC 7305]|uniref:RAMP superfamily CRISPR-associated protein n=1 Tax=Xenococcus sp. PCC 7305 TaxID=102125 RepID=UPI0002AC3059|nr:RAMP superfamily CRISPR-associated protein [Xenococcus sp. PCC 7305]ELS04984.1 uncharacterized protein predicted to be involved in DNA repair (RAMP superfamily) [Xenococcus sp. PCC 7305]
MEIVDQWQNFVAAEQKTGSKLGKSLELATYAGYNSDTKILSLAFPDEASAKTARGLSPKIIKKLKQKPYRLQCDFIECKSGSVAKITTVKPQKINSNKTTPLQVLFHTYPNLPYSDSKQDKKQESEQKKQILEAAVIADDHCQDYYDLMRKRTEILAGGSDHCFVVSCNWRLRVGGIRGYRELLLPAFHPILGIPYIPASTLKGAARAWGIKHDDPEKVKELLGVVDTDISKTKAAQVAFLDAYPIKPCLSLDVATPQWHWDEREREVKYSPEPHLFLSLYQPEILIGISASAQVSQDDYNTVRKWLKNALENGIGSRVSSGYGKFIPLTTNQYSLKFDFTLWTKGMYGANPQKQGTEFRSTAVRGVMRYWFRALSMGMYQSDTCKLLEDRIFGTLSKPGLINIYTKVNSVPKSEAQGFNPIEFTGSIIIESQSAKTKKFSGYLLLLASSLGGLGHGSRRPLHVLAANSSNSLREKMIRGCHWEVDSNDLALEYPLVCEAENWQKFFELLKQSLKNLVKELKPKISKNQARDNQPTPNFATDNRECSPSFKGDRRQDVLDKNVAIYLIPCPELIQPNPNIDWASEGLSEQIRGRALVGLYSDDKFKGGNSGVNVGGKLGVPSYVWIKSIFPYRETPFQVVTIFDVKNPQRAEFAKLLEKLPAVKVFG